MLGLYAEHTRLADDELPTIPARTVAGLRTHDMEPFATLYERGDLADYRAKLQRCPRPAASGSSRAALLEGALIRLASSDAYLVARRPRRPRSARRRRTTSPARCCRRSGGGGCAGRRRRRSPIPCAVCALADWRTR